MKKLFMRFFCEKDDEKIFNSFVTFFTTICVCLLSVICFSQLGLAFSQTRQVFTNVDLSDGAILAGYESVIDKGIVTLKIHDKPDEKVKILVNGEVFTEFTGETANIDIYNQSVIEIKNESGHPVTVSLMSVSDNLTTVLNNESVTVDKIEVLCRVIFKE